MNNLKAVFISDIHLAPGEDWSHCIWKYTPNEELPGLLEQWKNMVNDELKPDVVFELGDRIIDVDRATDLRNTTAVRDAVDGSVHCPVYHVDGNHDFINITKDEIAGILGNPRLPYSVVQNGWKFVFFDSLDPMLEGVGGEVGQAQLDWLQKQMNEDDLPKLVFSHHPLNYHQIHRNYLIPEGTYHLMSVKNSGQIREILEGGKNFIAHCAGHSHFWAFRSSARGTYLVNPPISAAHPAFKNAPGWFMEATFSTDGTVDAVIHSLNPKRVVGNFTNR